MRASLPGGVQNSGSWPVLEGVDIGAVGVHRGQRGLMSPFPGDARRCTWGRWSTCSTSRPLGADLPASSSATLYGSKRKPGGALRLSCGDRGQPNRAGWSTYAVNLRNEVVDVLEMDCSLGGALLLRSAHRHHVDDVSELVGDL
jgi:hypothetical protein